MFNVDGISNVIISSPNLLLVLLVNIDHILSVKPPFCLLSSGPVSTGANYFSLTAPGACIPLTESNSESSFLRPPSSQTRSLVCDLGLAEELLCPMFLKPEWGVEGQKWLEATPCQVAAEASQPDWSTAGGPSFLLRPGLLELYVVVRSRVSLSSLLAVLPMRSLAKQQKVWVPVVCLSCLKPCIPNWYMLDFQPVSTLSWKFTAAFLLDFLSSVLPSFSKFSTFFQSGMCKIKSLS